MAANIFHISNFTLNNSQESSLCCQCSTRFTHSYIFDPFRASVYKNGLGHLSICELGEYIWMFKNVKILL